MSITIRALRRESKPAVGASASGRRLVLFVDDRLLRRGCQEQLGGGVQIVPHETRCLATYRLLFSA